MRFLHLGPEGSQNMAGFFSFFLFSYSFCSQIWLNNNVIDCQWSYIKKIEGKKKKKKNHFLAIENFKNKNHFWIFDLKFFFMAEFLLV